MMKRLSHILLTLLMIVALAVSLTPQPVYAAVDTLGISGDGTDQNVAGTYGGGAKNYTNLNSDDDEISYWQGTTAGGGWKYRSWHTEDFTSGGTITKVRFTVKLRASFTGQEIRPYVFIDGTRYLGDISSPGTTSYTEFYKDWATNPATGSAWTTNEYNNAQFGVGINTGTAVILITYAYISLTYNPATAPVVTTSTASGILYDGQYKATLNGVVTDTSQLTIDYYGFVWDTSDKGNPGNDDPSTPPGTWTNGWKSSSGNYGTTPFNHQISGLNKNTTYYFRAAAHNSEGWSYGDTVSFRTLTDPSINTVAATNISASTAQLNSLVTDDGMLGGGASCNVTFVYKENAGAHYANYAAILADGGTEVKVSGTYNTGNQPYYEISGLTILTNVDYAVKITNSVSTQYGAVMYFTTKSGVSEPTNLVAIPTDTTISLSWVKGDGASNTFIRYDISTYPSAVTGGMGTIYAGTGSSYLLENLIPGKNYYISAWGLTSGVYSGSYTTVMATCLAEGAAGVPTLPPPGTPGAWTLTPSTSAIQNFPLYDFVNFFADNYRIPQPTMWYGLFVVFAVSLGLFTYWRGNQNLLAAMLATAIGLIIGAIVGLVYLWIAVFFLMAGISMAWLAQRWS